MPYFFGRRAKKLEIRIVIFCSFGFSICILFSIVISSTASTSIAKTQTVNHGSADSPAVSTVHHSRVPFINTQRQERIMFP
jgi:hypothetical protein